MLNENKNNGILNANSEQKDCSDQSKIIKL